VKGRITDDERRRAVELVESGKLSALEVADSLGITAGTFARWRRRFAGDNSVESRGVAASDVQPTGEPASQRESVLGPGRSRSSSASNPLLLAAHTALFPRSGEKQSAPAHRS
jgi:transposase-like protein